MRRVSSFLVAFILVNLTFLSAQDALDLYRQRRYTDAIAVTLKEIERDRTNMDAYSVLGWSLNLLKRHAEAADYGRKAHAINKADHRIVGVLAEAYFGLKQDANALENYEKFISLGSSIPGWDPRNLRDAYKDMGDIYFRLKEYHRADFAYTTALSYDKGKSAFDNVRAAKLIAQAALAREYLKDVKRAQTAYQLALSRDPGNNEAKEGLARIKTAADSGT